MLNKTNGKAATVHHYFTGQFLLALCQCDCLSVCLYPLVLQFLAPRQLALLQRRALETGSSRGLLWVGGAGVSFEVSLDWWW